MEFPELWNIPQRWHFLCCWKENLIKEKNGRFKLFYILTVYLRVLKEFASLFSFSLELDRHKVKIFVLSRSLSRVRKQVWRPTRKHWVDHPWRTSIIMCKQKNNLKTSHSTHLALERLSKGRHFCRFNQKYAFKRRSWIFMWYEVEHDEFYWHIFLFSHLTSLNFSSCARVRWCVWRCQMV